MFPYVAHLFRKVDGGEEWQVWIGTAPSEEACQLYVDGLINDINYSVERPDEHWRIQTFGHLDLATAITGGQVMVSTSFHKGVCHV
jgi:hypothetical protein